MHYPVQITEDPCEGGYVVSFPDLPGCLTCGETLEEAMANAEDARRCWLEVAVEQGYDIQEPGKWDSPEQFKLRIPKSLHEQLIEGASKAGMSLSRYCVNLLSKGSMDYKSTEG
ncbi:MAG: type II toxin-antitoxin system HicB family antitoxin [Clostridia bacterium]|nr:type II toxin-antitoxin system HicB family antitoxin [Clostridia bacterium]